MKVSKFTMNKFARMMIASVKKPVICLASKSFDVVYLLYMVAKAIINLKLIKLLKIIL